MPKTRQQTRDDFEKYPTNPHILDVARRVHPTWLVANGHKHDTGVEDLAREIGQCVAASQSLQDSRDNSVTVGHGIVVVRGPGIDGWSVCVISGEVFNSRLPGGIRADG